jgi:hypothetical protein
MIPNTLNSEAASKHDLQLVTTKDRETENQISCSISDARKFEMEANEMDEQNDEHRIPKCSPNVLEKGARRKKLYSYGRNRSGRIHQIEAKN